VQPSGFDVPPLPLPVPPALFVPPEPTWPPGAAGVPSMEPVHPTVEASSSDEDSWSQ
jgi:hypothetical protein